MGSADATRKSFWVDPARNLSRGVIGDKATEILIPNDPLSGYLQKEGGEWLDKDRDAAEKEAKRQDEILKRLALGENPYLDTTEETGALGA